ncbi:TPA: phage head closure protein [Yersinia enterocolitica]|uniref:phage head closure protein n=1 Tax=Yersinia enterocolitica TaxID=630 RepID=UPI0005E74EF4|nr:phage head closure protein [Yersinia enterocolitica]CNF82875.1 Bacteriophage head-tail adaptor [Yersinia enterocolitica]HDL6967019.1 phage head closure protein [Yersinia enterocolitica]HDL6975106.1 phage head closure protein [Yersinia enterocolitica]HDL6996406.1 phage head closure protein [Yersinia enterocolitica]HDL7095393.1 phage head closure protein [Yersinia enterocolitica]
MTQRRFTEINATYRSPAPGELNKRAQFRTREDVPGNGHMGVDTVYHNTFDSWAKLAAIGDSVRIGSVQIDAAITHRIVIRYRTGVTTDDEVVINKMVYRVKGTTNLNEASRFLVITAEELGSVEAIGEGH